MLNKVQIIGRVGRDPEVRYSAGGEAIANVSVATSESWKDKTSGEKKERTEWHRVAVFGKLAEIVGQYLKQGAQVYFEGKLQTREWEKDGVKRYTTEIVVDSFSGAMKMLGGKSEGGGGQQRQGGYDENAKRPQPTQQSAAPPLSGASQPPDDDDDIPF